MTENQKHLQEARVGIKQFEAEQEPERLREASLALDNVILSQEQDSAKRLKMRTETLNLWLQLLQILDSSLDPNFNEDEVPELFVEPPPVSGGKVLRPGANPEVIPDPIARAEYEKAIAANREKTNQYRIQVGLHRLDERVPVRAEAFMRMAYTSSLNDQEELRSAIEKMIKDPQRRTKLLTVLVPFQ